MGCSAQAACVTCKLHWYCGYGSYSSYEDRLTRAPLELHEGHDLESWNEDFVHMDGPNLMGGGFYTLEEYLIIKDLDSFTEIDMSDEPIRPELTKRFRQLREATSQPPIQVGDQPDQHPI